ncbi:hypothetical protein GCM10018780_29970 [Streptomyces lanatus]|nr:hypothetical protein GCM10018780_29970 [Streptomyces lanatus]
MICGWAGWPGSFWVGGAGDGYCSLGSRNTGKCLGVSRAGTVHVIRWPCKGHAGHGARRTAAIGGLGRLLRFLRPVRRLVAAGTRTPDRKIMPALSPEAPASLSVSLSSSRGRWRRRVLSRW